MTSLTNLNKKQRPKSQAQLKKEIENALRNREMVALWGNQANGKTHTFWQLWVRFMIGIDGKDITTIKPNHPENPALHILPHVEVSGASDRLEIDRVKRQILMTYGVPKAANMSKYHMRIEFIKLCLKLQEMNIIPCIAMDNIELIPERGYTLLKGLNELNYTGKRCGFAILASGEFRKRKMPINFWQHCTEFNVGKVSFQEMEEFISNLVGPQFLKSFKSTAIKRLLECTSTLEMANIVRRVARDISEEVIETADEELIGTYHEKERVQQLRLAA